MHKRINVGVVGCGYWGPNLIRNFQSISEVTVKTVCDKSLERLTHMRNLFAGVEITMNFDDMVQDAELDAIVVATPVSTHFRLAKKSLMANKHTFIEKPMAASVEECRILNELADSRGLTLMVGHTFIYNPAVRKIKEIIDSGEIGEIMYISSRRLNLGLFQKDINVVWDLAPHDLSIILYLLDEEPISVNCQGKHHYMEGIEDVANLTLNFANGGFASITSSWLDPHKVREMKIVGTKKMIVYDDIEPLEKIRIYDKRVSMPVHYDSFAEFQYSYHYGDVYVPYIKQTEPLKMEAMHFIDSIRENTRPLTSGWEGLTVIQILEAANESLRRKGASIQLFERPVPVKFVA